MIALVSLESLTFDGLKSGDFERSGMKLKDSELICVDVDSALMPYIEVIG